MNDSIRRAYFKIVEFSIMAFENFTSSFVLANWDIEQSRQSIGGTFTVNTLNFMFEFELHQIGILKKVDTVYAVLLL